ncbi:MAG: hypothetical protein KGZ79_00390 [Dethiobacter sp.]|nr:hypothetical protein [Dethiobacter sp.]
MPDIVVNELPPASSSEYEQYVLVSWNYEIRDVSICANIDSPEIIRGDTVNGLFQIHVLKIDYWQKQIRGDLYDRDYLGEDEDGKPIYGPWYWAGYTAWSNSGAPIPVHNSVDGNFTIASSIGNTTTLTPSSGSWAPDRYSFTWRTTGISSSTINTFTLTVAAPGQNSNGTTTQATATDSATVFLPREVRVEPITMLSGNVHLNNKQIAFVRVTNLRDVGEENVTLTYTLNNSVVKQETIFLPGGSTGTAKSVLRAFEFTPKTQNVILQVSAAAAKISDDSNEKKKTLSHSRTQTYSAIAPYTKSSVSSLTNRTQASLPVTYHYSTSVTSRNYVNSIMPEVNYNTYTWTSRTENYLEQLNVSLTVDSWQSTPDKGRGAWEIMPLFGAQAHRTVRAGTGFEPVVATNYTTDFDSRAPSNHRGDSMRLNVTPDGPGRVFAAFPYANFIKSISPNDNVNYVMGKIGYPHGEESDLQSTSGNPGAHQIKWELPEHTYTGESGTYRARTHLIDKFFPDAYPSSYDNTIRNYMGTLEPKITFDDRYRFTVVSEVAGVSNLIEVKEDFVFIFGHIFRDIWQTRAISSPCFTKSKNSTK